MSEEIAPLYIVKLTFPRTLLSLTLSSSLIVAYHSFGKVTDNESCITSKVDIKITISRAHYNTSPLEIKEE